jgi:sugar phosphate isomerase/epimerase
MHPRVSLHQVAYMGEPTRVFLDHCTAIGVAHATLVTPALATRQAIDEARHADVRIATINHGFAQRPDLESDAGEAVPALLETIDTAAILGAKSIYLLTGGRGGLDWEAAAARFADLLAPAREAARAKGIRLLVENANAFNADIHIAHTLTDAIRLAEIAGIGVCVELHACWGEAGLSALFRPAMPAIGLVQVSDYVLGDRSTPCRAVPGDGTIPLDWLIGDLLDAGYAGLFDLELVGPRIAAEGPRAATARGAERLSALLDRLGA